MFTKPKLFFDTSVCIDISRSGIPSDEQQGTFRRIRQRYWYCISPLTIYELVSGLATSGENHFIQSREAIRIVYPTGPKQILGQLRVFVPNTIFAERRTAPASVETNFDLWIKAVLRAPSKEALESGRLRIGLRKGFGLDLVSINQEMRHIEAGFAGIFTALRQDGVQELTRELWAGLILQRLRKELTPDNLGLILERLDAAYRFDSCLWHFIKHPNYDFMRHTSELVDAQQLHYLCDPEMYFVTNEVKLRNRIASSPQSSRILTYDELCGTLGS